MVLPILGLLALGAAGSAGMTFANDARTASRRRKKQGLLDDAMTQILGEAPQIQAGPRREQFQGQELMSEGSGLLANPTGRAEQIRAGMGLMQAGFETPGNALLQQGTSVADPAKPDSFTNKLLQMGLQPGTPEWQSTARDLAMKPSTKIDMNSNKLVTATDSERIRLPDGSIPTPGTRYSDLPGMGAQFIQKRTPEQAGKIAQMEGAQAQIPLIESFMFNDKGDIDRTNIFTSDFNIPGTEGQTLATAYEAGIQAITRSETGAAMPETEVENARTRFQPKTLDTDLTIRLKWDMYQDFLNGTLKLIKSGGIGELPKFNVEAFEAELKKRRKQATISDGGWKVEEIN